MFYVLGDHLYISSWQRPLHSEDQDFSSDISASPVKSDRVDVFISWELSNVICLGKQFILLGLLPFKMASPQSSDCIKPASQQKAFKNLFFHKHWSRSQYVNLLHINCFLVCVSWYLSLLWVHFVCFFSIKKSWVFNFHSSKSISSWGSLINQNYKEA